MGMIEPKVFIPCDNCSDEYHPSNLLSGIESKKFICYKCLSKAWKIYQKYLSGDFSKKGLKSIKKEKKKAKIDNIPCSFLMKGQENETVIKFMYQEIWSILTEFFDVKLKTSNSMEFKAMVTLYKSIKKKVSSGKKLDEVEWENFYKLIEMCYSMSVKNPKPKRKKLKILIEDSYKYFPDKLQKKIKRYIT